MSFTNIFFNNLTSNYKEIKFKNNQKVNLFFFDASKKNKNTSFKCFLKNNNEINFYCLILANKCTKNFSFCFYHQGNDSKSELKINLLGNNHSEVKTTCFSHSDKTTKNNVLNQNINGLIFDQNSLLQVSPNLAVDNNQVLANHSVNIGQLEPEIIFYLNTKGLTEQTIYKLILNDYTKLFDSFFKQHKINFWKKIKIFFTKNE